MVSLKVHNRADYAVGAFLLFTPYLFGFQDVKAAHSVMMLSGTALILYSLFTNYYFSLMRVLPLGVHMTFDVLIGAFLLSAPSVFDYRIFLTPTAAYLHYGLGIGLIGLVALTRERTEDAKRRDGLVVDQTLNHGI